MNFIKMQGAGNDFVLVETGNTERDWSRMAVVMCDRHFGIGADGLLLLLSSDIADFQMRVFNPDGSEAEACGNGLRCLAKYVIDRGLADTGNQEILIETLAGVRRVKVDEAARKLDGLQISMGAPGFGAEYIPVVREQGVEKLVDIKSMSGYSVIVEGHKLELNLVSMGNPHAVHFYDRPVVDFPLLQLGPKLENHRVFPNGLNFEVARVISRQQLEARVWERGVGETLACGSGACAIAVAARLHDYTDNTVHVKLPGGILDVEWDGVGEVFLSGPAEVVFTGQWSDKDDGNL